MNNLLDKIQLFKPKQNSFDLSHEKKISASFGKLYPILLQDVIPGDKFKVNSEILVRMAPMLSPVMHRLAVTTHYFFVPNRILWDEWEDFITGGEDGLQAPVFPQVAINDGNKTWYATKTLADYFGLPITDASVVTNELNVSALPFRAYQTIFNEYYRDQNLQPKIDILKTGGTSVADTVAIHNMRTRAWEKDYFTSALPWAQRGGDVNLPVSFKPTYLDTSLVKNSATGNAPTGNSSVNYTDQGSPAIIGAIADSAGNARIENLETTQDGVSVTINELRKATALQRWLEKSARGGSRYAEQLLTFWGVRSSDARLQRPEYLGGGKNNISISEVLSTLSSDTTPGAAPQGNMAGHGISMGKSNSFSRRFEEHGHIIGIMSILPRTGYQQGVEKHWTKTDKYEFPWPEFAQLGEQTVDTRELYQDYAGTAEDQANPETFGYQSRYAEYKFKQNSTAGDMRTTLNFWHLNRIFTSKPALNQAFVTSDADTRIWPVNLPSEDHFYIQLYNKVHVMRSLPYFNNPTIR